MTNAYSSTPKTIRLGDAGTLVRNLQERLKDLGYDPNGVDGHFGSGTDKAVKAFQKAEGQVIDGIVGERTWKALQLVRGHTVPSWALTESDMVKAASELDLDVAIIKAFSEVESDGYGFIESTGKPVILYERHLFYRIAKERGLHLLTKLAVADRPDLVNRSWGGYRGGALEYTRRNKAMELNPEIALESCSYGRYQILGMHWERLGYDSIHDFVGRMETNEAEHLTALVRFIRADNRLLVALSTLDFETAARIYNGPAFKKNNYDQKLRAAYQRYKETA